MWHWMIVACGWGIFGLMLFSWVRWTERERDLFANGNGRYLE
jgi:hypothetical protein